MLRYSVWHYLSQRILIKRPVNVLSAFTGRFVVVWLCWWFCDWNRFWVVLNWFASCWLVVFGRGGVEMLLWRMVFMDFVMNCLWFWFFCNFLSCFLLGCCGCYRPLKGGFTGWLKLIAIKNLFKTVLLWICWNNLWARCWRLVGKCVIFGFFAADTATKQPKWLIRKCRSTVL